jgi:hypothetical protein
LPAGKNSLAIITAKKPKMIKSNHSNTLPIDAAATERQRAPFPGWVGEWAGHNSVNAAPRRSPDLTKDDPDSCQSIQCRLLTGSSSTSTAGAPPKTMPLARKDATRPNKRERHRSVGRTCPHHCDHPPTANLPPQNATSSRLSTTSARPSTACTPPDAFRKIQPIKNKIGQIRALTTKFQNLCVRKLAAACVKATSRTLAAATHSHVPAGRSPRQVEECNIDWRWRTMARSEIAGRGIELCQTVGICQQKGAGGALPRRVSATVNARRHRQRHQNANPRHPASQEAAYVRFGRSRPILQARRHWPPPFV